MGLTRKDIFTDQQNELATIAKALGHPARIAILEHLLNTNQCVCGDLVGEIGLAQPTISQHLKELKNCGLITGTIEGTRVCYCIHEDKWIAVRDLFNSFLSRYIPNPNICC